jgi:5-(carboxyamino)imidazole ribonucleotide synthase
MKVGVFGGGQLAQMMAIAGQPLGIELVCIEPSNSAPAATHATVVHGPFDTTATTTDVFADCDVVTVELEAVPIDALRHVARTIPVRPAIGLIADSQDRRAEKQRCRSLGLVTAPYDAEVGGPPALVKTRRGGYDGKGQRLVRTNAELDAAVAELPEPIVEGLVPFDREVSIVGARSLDGEVRCWPLAENSHRDGILHVSTPFVDAALHASATDIITAVMEAHDVVGVMCVELFDVGGTLVVNEFAPRVHNSGHWTIDGSTTSQFEQHLRAICGLPLGIADLVRPCAMVNLIGSIPDGLDALPGAVVHRYGKSPLPGRKLGHINVLADDATQLAERLDTVTRWLTHER